MAHTDTIVEKGSETTNNLMVLKRLFPLLIGGDPVAKPTILWFDLWFCRHGFWRLDQSFSNSENSLLLCASKPSGKHAGF
jgi:hypothetical protein